MKINGIAIAVAWPETICKQAGAWYDTFLLWLGINRNHYYKVGHAAIILINCHTSECLYFDFGRYHAPFGHGRVRDKITDHELVITTKAQINLKGEPDNLMEILSEIKCNDACHGTGDMYASWCKIDLVPAFTMAKKMQHASPIRYGPFVINGTNCSRFVNKILRSGNPGWLKKLFLSIPLTITPTPMHNVICIGKKIHLKKIGMIV